MLFSDFTKVKECLDFSLAGKNQVIFGLGDGEKSFFAGMLNKQLVIVAPDFISATIFKGQLVSMGKKAEIISGGIESPVYVYWQDTSAMQNLIKNISLFLTKKLDALIILPEVLTVRLPNKERFMPLVLNSGKMQERDKLIEFLLESGYVSSAIVSGEGEFSVRGDIVDVFGLGFASAVRINFFGDEIENMYYYNLENMSKEKEVSTLNIFPSTIFFDNNYEEISKILENELKNSNLNQTAFLKLKEITEKVLDALIHNPTSLNLAFTTVFNKEMKNNILDLFDFGVLVLDQPQKILQMLDFAYSSFYNNTLKLVSDGMLTKKHFEYLIDKNKVFQNQKITTLIFEDTNTNQLPYTAQKSTTFKSFAPTRYLLDFNALARDVKKFLLSSYKIVLYAGSKNSKDKIKEFLFEKAISVYDESQINFLKKGVFVLEDYLYKSVQIEQTKTILIATEDLIKTTSAQTSLKKKSVFYLPKVGEYIVHEFHGVGKCVAIERLKLGNYEKDYFVLEYQKGDKIYIPTEQANTISAYVGGEENPKLNKLGGLEFARLKARAKKSIEELAINLLELYAKREAQKGFVFEKDSYLSIAFDDAFEFEETPDQLQAINEIKEDMESQKIMDRLLCGDVGYGKTEVALRAAYKAILSGKQVAILCPTTILAEQHYKTCLNRFKNFMVNVKCINRLVKPKQQKQILKLLNDGNVDIIIGTHRLLGADVKFKDLGLLILDEEQRFGVGHKEKIKTLKENIDVLTLSATPIPRTLHMSLSGIRDISIIETPPKGRIAVQTFVAEFDLDLLKNVLQRELSRQGQAYVVFNRVDKIYDFARQIQNLFPKMSVGIAHGQMDRKTLEDTVLKLYNGQFDILVATTLIENGIDIANANTLVVIDADKLGLSSLYQLKGRVGRSTKVAYAYFMYQKNKVLTEQASKRLKAISEFSSLGSGFKIAMRDMEIRGAGSVLGDKQHGHIEKVGYDLYLKLLQEVMLEKKGQTKKERKPIKMDISLSAFLPQDYIESEDARIKIYTEISMLETKSDFDNLLEKLNQDYGNMPKEVLALCKIALIKNLASAHDVKTVKINKDKTVLELYKKEEILDEFLSRALEKNKHLAVLKFELLPIIEFDNLTVKIEKKLQTVFEFFVN